MATVKAVLRPPIDSSGKKGIYIRISDKGKTKYSSIGAKVKPKYWNKKSGSVRENDIVDNTHLNQLIDESINEVRNNLYKLKIERKRHTPDVLKKKLKQAFNDEEYTKDFIAYAQLFADRKRQNNIQTGRRYDAIVSKLKQYSEGPLPFSEISVTFLNEYSDWLADKKKNSNNTIHSNLRAIRAILYSAIEEDLFPQEKNPFFKFKLRQPKVHRAKLTIEEIKAIEQQIPGENPIQSLAKDMFLFSFFTCGMRFRDVIKLKWQNIENGVVRYTMNKTGKAHSVVLVEPAKKILQKYKTQNVEKNHFIFPALKNYKKTPSPKELDRKISGKNAYLNKELDKLVKAAGISKKVSFHVARHSYAFIAKNQGTDIHTISQSLGHSSLKTTETYLNSLDNLFTNSAITNIYSSF